MNTGIQDSQNLGWKLACVLRGEASDALLDTYEVERRPVALDNAAQAMLSTERMAEVGWVMADPAALARIETREGAAVRREIAAAIPAQRDGYWSQGQQFGFIYNSAAVIDDSTDAPESTVGEYRMSAHPGARAPHCWLSRRDGSRVSTIDLFGRHFVALVGAAGQAWLEPIRRLSEVRRLELDAYVIGPAGDLRGETDAWHALYGVSPRGLVLVRPDGHVAFRAQGSNVPDRQLGEALDALLGVAAPEGKGEQVAA
jgi:putative polyketide hydroxylase